MRPSALAHNTRRPSLVTQMLAKLSSGLPAKVTGSSGSFMSQITTELSIATLASRWPPGKKASDAIARVCSW